MSLAKSMFFNETLKPRASSADACNSKITVFKETQKSIAFSQNKMSFHKGGYYVYAILFKAAYISDVLVAREGCNYEDRDV
jgi:hypothetical protein